MSIPITFYCRTSTKKNYDTSVFFTSNQIIQTDKFIKSKNPNNPNLNVPVYQITYEAERLTNFLEDSCLKDEINFDISVRKHFGIININWTDFKNESKDYELAMLLSGNNKTESLQILLMMTKSEDEDNIYYVDSDIDGERYLVLTEKEAQDKFVEHAESYPKDCFTCNFPEHIKIKACQLFADEIIKERNRGTALSTYDYIEYETPNYFVYRLD